jgi:hypothetical protein
VVPLKKCHYSDISLSGGLGERSNPWASHTTRHNVPVGTVADIFPKQCLAVGILTVLLRGLDLTGVAGALAGMISCCKYVVIIDGTLKNVL